MDMKHGKIDMGRKAVSIGDAAHVINQVNLAILETWICFGPNVYFSAYTMVISVFCYIS
jgi:hypothetical protein